MIMKDGIWPLLRCHDASSHLAKGNNVDYFLQCRQAGAFQVKFMEATRVGWLI